MTLWSDARAYSVYQEIEARHPSSFWRSFSLRDGPGMGLTRLAMMLRTAPQLISDRTLYVGAGEFLYFHLTESWRQDGCHAQQTGCYDARRDVLTERPLKEIGVPVSSVACTHGWRRGLWPVARFAGFKLFVRVPGIPPAAPATC